MIVAVPRMTMGYVPAGRPLVPVVHAGCLLPMTVMWPGANLRLTSRVLVHPESPLLGLYADVTGREPVLT